MADKPSAPSLASLTQHILNETLYSIIHNVVLETHTSETALRRTCDPKTNLPLCASCGLPRLLEPPLSISRPDKSTQYCSHVPWSRRAGHDIYGNPFPVAGSDKPPTKKEREARAKAEQKRKDSTANAGEDEEGPNIAGGPVDKKAAKVGERLKGGTYVPWHTCPSCKRSLLITRFAQHLEKCLGIGGRGRAAARNGGSQTGSAGGSRGATPTKKEESDEEDVGMRKKVLKKGLKKQEDKKEGRLSAPKDGKVSKLLKLSTGGGDNKDGEKTKEKRPRPSGDEDDEDEDATPLRKKAKLQRQLSTASLMSSATGPGSVAGDQDAESADGDGSFVYGEEVEEDDD
ncbi:hypothetical protein K461DRAFT_281465 [Myriangium duriaei CBS 260.36]|uniref:SAGA-associated factor 11 n=1 Tax=Myriangium duriaei CBS 260.36 TaxID=1168546 RepID=A0A9P4J0K9_9PEZI|nr:hypothetical protein K461DRAFT_281465 [Myriangium duriaei CBS 260.36]